MELFIKIQDGQPVNHPIIKDNFCQAYPEIDINNLPSEFARFERVQQPSIGPYEEIVGCSYQWVDGIVKDVWEIRELTADEKLVKQNAVKENWQQFGFNSWIFNEELCVFEPPTPRPGDQYRWDEETLSWVSP